MTRDDLIEAMARAICSTFYSTLWEFTSEFRRGLCIEMAASALAAIEAAGCVVIPVRGRRWWVGRQIGDTFAEDDDFDGDTLVLELFSPKDAGDVAGMMIRAIGGYHEGA